MVDLLFCAIPDLQEKQAKMSFRRQKGMNGHHTNQQYKTHSEVEWEYVYYPPNPLGRHPFNIITEEIYEHNTD